MQVNVFFFPPSFDMWKEEGKGLLFFNHYFHCWVAREGEGVDFFVQFHNGMGRWWLKIAIFKY